VRRSIAPSALLALGIGAAAAVYLYATNDVSKVLSALALAGWGILAVVAAHVPATVAATAGWRAMIPRGGPPLTRLFLFRWIKEAVNSLLPVGQVGGDVVRTRLLIRSGIEPRTAIAGSVVDVAVGTASLFAYLLLGLGFLLLEPHKGLSTASALRAIALTAVVGLAAAVAPRLGLIRLIDRIVIRLRRGAAAAEGQDDAAIDEAATALSRHPAALASCAAYHLAAWGLGAFEAFVTLKVLHLGATWSEAFLVDTLGQGFRAAGFLIPGALGVQEGGFIIVFAMFGVPAEGALAFSTIRRLREVALGVPGLFAWAGLEGGSRPDR
jgi:putative membrane protein